MYVHVSINDLCIFSHFFLYPYLSLIVKNDPQKEIIKLRPTRMKFQRMIF